MKTEYKLKVIHNYGKTHDWDTLSNNCGITLVSWADSSYNMGAFGKDKLDAIDNLYMALMKEMKLTVMDIERLMVDIVENEQY